MGAPKAMTSLKRTKLIQKVIPTKTKVPSLLSRPLNPLYLTCQYYDLSDQKPRSGSWTGFSAAPISCCLPQSQRNASGGTRKAELCHRVVLFRDCHPSLCLTESLRIETYNVNIKGQKQKQEEEKMLRKSQFFGTDIPELSVSMEMIGNCS